MLIFLHGFLGCPADWEPLLTDDSIALELPGHGKEPFNPDIAGSLKKRIPPGTHHLVGYSAGGRVALQLKARYPDAFDKLLIFSAHPGLHSAEEREARWKQDQPWIKLLEEGDLKHFIRKWYEQPLFAMLKKDAAFYKKRMQHDPAGLAAFMRAFSLGKHEPPPLFPGTHFVAGAQDLKYAAFSHTLIPHAGHALLQEAPEVCRGIIRSWFYE